MEWLAAESERYRVVEFPSSTHEVLDLPTQVCQESPDPESPDPESPDPIRKVFVIVAAKGMGKSKAIRRAVSGRTSVLNITFRRSLARSSSADIPGCAVYMDHDDLGKFEHGVLTVLINSLLRVNHNPEVVILDEWVSILEMLGSDLLDDERRYQIIKRLVRFVTFAKLIIVSDALLDKPSMDCLIAMLDAKEELTNAEIAYDMTVLKYLHKPHADHEFVHHARLDKFLEQIVHSVLVQQHKVVIPCMTKAFAVRIHETVSSWGRRTLLYTADDSEALVKTMVNIHDAWEQCDILIYSPVITAGCSFETRGHFDECFLYAYQGTASVRSALQMMFRVRDLACKRVHVHLEKGSMADFEQVHREVVRLRHSPSMHIHDCIMHMRKIREMDRRFCFGSAFWDLVRLSGITVQGDPVADPIRSNPQATLTALVQTRAELKRGFAKRTLHLGDLVDVGLLHASALDSCLMTNSSPSSSHPCPMFDALAQDLDPTKLWKANYFIQRKASISEHLQASTSICETCTTLLARIHPHLASPPFPFLESSPELDLLIKTLPPTMWPMAIKQTPSSVTSWVRVPIQDLSFHQAVHIMANVILGTLMCAALGMATLVGQRELPVTIVLDNVTGHTTFTLSTTLNLTKMSDALDFVHKSPPTNLERVCARLEANSLAGDWVKRHILRWARAKLDNRGGRGTQGPILDDFDVVSVEPMDPTIGPMAGGPGPIPTWTHPLSIAQALSIGTHALATLRISTVQFSLLIPCQPLFLRS
jgi:hypothetical protein